MPPDQNEKQPRKEPNLYGTSELKVFYQPDYLTEPASLWHYLTTEITWDERMQARKTACFGVPYNYSGMVYAAVPMPFPFLPVIDRLEARFGYRSNNCLLNYYETGHAKMGFHSDSNDDLVPGTGVAVVSLGSPRELVFRAKRKTAEEQRFTLADGSLLYMWPEVQDHWKHALPANPQAGPRISLTFRKLR